MAWTACLILHENEILFYSTHHFINEEPECQRLNNYPRASQRPHTAAHRPDLERDIFGLAYNAFDLIFVTCQHFNTGTFSWTTDLLYQIHFKIIETGEAGWRSLHLPGPSVPHFSASALSSPTMLAKEKWLLTEHDAIYMVFLVVFLLCNAAVCWASASTLGCCSGFSATPSGLSRPIPNMWKSLFGPTTEMLGQVQ